MEKFLEFLQKYFAVILFVVLEIFSFSITYKNKLETKAFFLNTTSFLESKIYSKIFKVESYLSLKKENEQLIENYRKILQQKLNAVNKCPQKKDYDSVYYLISANVIQNTVLLQNNYFTIDIGLKDGLYPEVGVVSPEGVVGIITNLNNNFAVGLSVLNRINGFSAKLKKNNYFGAITWDGEDYRYVILSEIPNHVKISKGDTIVTSGFDLIFPPNYPVGTIDTFYKNSQDNFYTIKVKLFQDLKTVSKVFVVINKNKQQIQNVQSDLEKILH